MTENLTPPQLNLGCQAGSTAACEDGVAPEGALQSGDGIWTKEMKSAAMRDAQNVCDLSMIVRKFLYRIDRGLPLEDFAEKVEDFMHRKGLNGSPLRSADEEAVPADTVSAASSEGSLTPQNYEAKAREIAFDIMSLGWRDESKPGEIIFYDEQVEPELFSAISSALSTAFEEGKRVERERCIGLVNTVRWGYVTPSSPPYNRGYNSGADEMRQWIASAIRKENDNGC